MKTRSDQWPVMSAPRAAARLTPAGHSSLNTRHSLAFTLIELLVVISILGILAALTVPALKNIGKTNVQISAARQLLDDIGHARQLAISQHTTVYMVFVPLNFWYLTTNRTVAATNLLDKQLSGYVLLSKRSVGDQPGRSTPRYLSEWKSLPEGSFIPWQKFIPPTQWYFINAYDPNIRIYGFSTNEPVPFPTEDSVTAVMPYIAFNYLGQLMIDSTTSATADAYIPLAQGNVAFPIDVNTKSPIFPATPLTASDVTENPPGNSTNSMFSIVKIDRLTGRATQLLQKIP